MKGYQPRKGFRHRLGITGSYSTLKVKNILIKQINFNLNETDLFLKEKPLSRNTKGAMRNAFS